MLGTYNAKKLERKLQLMSANDAIEKCTELDSAAEKPSFQYSFRPYINIITKIPEFPFSVYIPSSNKLYSNNS